MENTNTWLRWTEDDDEYIRQHILSMDQKALAAALGRSAFALNSQIGKLGLWGVRKKQCNIKRGWSQKDKQFLIDNYGKLTYKEIGKCLHRSGSTVKKEASKLNICWHKASVDEPFLPEEDKILRTFYGKITYQEIKEKLNEKHSVGSITGRCMRLGLISPHNPMFGVGSSRIRAKVKDDFFSVPNILNCYWAGFLAADGYIIKSGRAIGLQLHQRDLVHMERFLLDIEYRGNHRVYVRKNGTPMCSVSVRSIRMVDDLRNNFNIVNKKSLILQPPSLMEPKLIDAFIVGYIDGDGSIFKRKNYESNIHISTVGTLAVNSWIQNRFQEIAQNVKIKNRGCVCEKGKGKCTSFSASNKLTRCFYDQIKNLDIPKLSRKWSKIIE